MGYPEQNNALSSPSNQLDSFLSKMREEKKSSIRRENIALLARLQIAEENNRKLQRQQKQRQEQTMQKILAEMRMNDSIKVKLAEQAEMRKIQKAKDISKFRVDP